MQGDPQFTQNLLSTVFGKRARRELLVIRTAPAIKYIIAREEDETGSHLSGSPDHIPRARNIDGVCRIPFDLTAVHMGEAGREVNDLGAQPFYQIPDAPIIPYIQRKEAGLRSAMKGADNLPTGLGKMPEQM